MLSTMIGNLLEYFGNILSSPTGLLLAVSIVLLSWHYLRMLAKGRGLPPGPIPLPLIGTMYVFPTDLSNLPFVLSDLAVKYGGMCTLQSPRGNNTVIITDMSDFKEAFVKNTDGAGRPFSDGLYSQKLLNPYYPVAGVVFSDYDEQLKLQRNISIVALRSLGYGKKSIENKIIEEAGHLAEAFKEKNGKPFTAKELLDNAVANIICALLFDQRYEYGDKEFIELREGVDKAFEFIGTSALIDDLWFAKYLPSQRRKIQEFKKHINFADNFMWKKIKERREIMKKGEETSDFISVYLKEVDKSGGKLQDRSHQLMKDFFAAGAETTSTTLGWALYFMLKHPDVQTKIRNEIKSTIGEGVKPTLKDREKLPYTEAALTEVMRVTPTAPSSLPHKTIRDTELGGYKLPKGTRIFAMTLPTIWNDKLFPEPHVFKPERHLDCNGQFVKNENLTPFGVGRRSCLGEQLARQELFLFFTHLIQSFEFKVPEGETLPPQRGKWFMTYRPPAYTLTAKAIQ